MPGLIWSQSTINPTVASNAPADTLYIKSNEVAQPNCVLLDDFRRGYMGIKTIDENNIAGKGWPVGGVSGFDWGMNDQGFAPPNPAGGIINLGVLGLQPAFSRSPYVATSGIIGPSNTVNPVNNQGNDGMHEYMNAETHREPGRAANGYDEIWNRSFSFFVPANYFGAGNPSIGFLWNNLKHHTGNRAGPPPDDAGIFWYALGFNIGGGPTDQSTSSVLKYTNNHGPGGGTSFNQNISQIIHQSGHWMYEEHHIKLNSASGVADGIFELYVNDGGPTGDFSGQTPTLRSRFTNIDFGYNASPSYSLLGVTWAENWSPNDIQDTQVGSPTFGHYGMYGSHGQVFRHMFHVCYGPRSGPIGFPVYYN